MSNNINDHRKLCVTISYLAFLFSFCCFSMLPAQNQCDETPWEVTANDCSEVDEDLNPLNKFQNIEFGADYRLKVGDVLLISVYGEEGTEREVVVNPRGTLSYLFVESVPASGKNISELRESLQEQLRKYYRFVTLSITPIKFNAEYYTIIGEVKEPGKKPIIGDPTLLSAISQAKGFNIMNFRNQIIDLCDLEKAFIARNGEYIPIDFVSLVRHGDLSQDIPLQSGDYIYIPNITMKRVYVVGEVFFPITIDYLTDMSLVEAITEAGDVTERASSRVAVLRGSLSCPVHYLIDFNRIVKGCAPNFKLQPGDIVYVPPRSFTSLREILQEAARVFVDRASDSVGEEAFLQAHPHAGTDGRRRVK